MADEMLSIAGILVALTGIAIYCAIVVAKKTDKLLKHMIKSEINKPITVSFPDSVYQQNPTVHTEK